jgi:galactose mutarotase-like enzyme
MPVRIKHYETQKEVNALGYFGFEKVGGIFQFISSNGVEVLKTSYGGATLGVLVPDLNGKLVDVVAGFKELSQYEADPTYQGRFVPLSNRMRDYTPPGSETTSKLIINEEGRKCHLHGGPGGANQIWQSTIIKSDLGTKPGVSMSLSQPDGYNGRDGAYGHPGPVDMKVVLRLSENGAFTHNVMASTHRTGFFNPTEHSYINPSGVYSGKSMTEIYMYSNWTHHVVVDENLIPTGKKLEEIAQGSDMDFSTLRLIGESGMKLDDCFGRIDGKTVFAVLYDLKTGIGVRITGGPNTTMQCYMGGGLSGSPIEKNMAGCLEPGAAINGPNEPDLCNMLKVDPFAHAGQIYSRIITHGYFTKNLELGQPIN